MRFASFCLVLASILLAVPLSAQFSIEPAFPDLSFNRPVDLQHAGDGSERLFVVEQAGRILVFPNDRNASNAKVFLDIRDRVNDGGNEEGLLGLAFHPSYSDNGYLYVNYTASNPRRTVIARFSVDGSDPDAADPSSESVLLTFDQPFSNHNGGQVTFGPDGFLYIATGDGGSGGDPQNNAQNRANLLGKILRIDVDNAQGGKAYGIPADNPFAGNSDGFAEEIYAWGLRNPWRFSFDPETGRLWTGDVGQNKYEEVNIVEKGKNYGWRIMEGFHCFNPASGCDESGLVKPIVEYGRDMGASITGGYVYRGPSVPELVGTYVYADFVTGRIWGIEYNSPTDFSNSLLLNSGRNIASFGTDENEELYICSFDGSIYRFTPTVSSSTGELTLPAKLELHPAFPQPAIRGMHESVSLRFSLPEQTSVRLVLYDTLGRELRVLQDATLSAGEFRNRLDVGTLPAGIYFYSLHTGDQRLTRKLLLLD